MCSKTLWASTLCLTIVVPGLACAQGLPAADIAPLAWPAQVAAPAPAASGASFTQLSAPAPKANTATTAAQESDRPGFLLPLAGLAALLFVAQRHGRMHDRSAMARRPRPPVATTGFGALGTDAS